ncbi:hypothetical protein Lepto7376_4531 [[Leptolyngbya] sp. PCC 7376]|uniref:hypothetical protein n=1 Tax=[Leptolyngbya] sp. PCC 7376 TaxID=111781 RepID=UPI00029F1508|nr:hypothetical protein [[Leptolyngbya] sp. PCC 7376]AFY40629.1 hypothetical protein Lepto7376_4531 [[Leptolyngbya] sp. PCC 7376]
MTKPARSESPYEFTVDGDKYSVSLIERNYDGFNDLLGLTKRTDSTSEDSERLTIVEAVEGLLLVPVKITYEVKGKKRNGKAVLQQATIYCSGDQLKDVRKNNGGLKDKKYNGQKIVKVKGDTEIRKVGA